MRNGLEVDIGRQRAALWLAAIVLVGTAMRLFRLGAEPLWHDEVFELLQAEDLWATLLTGANVSSHPPLYAVLLKIPEFLGLHATEWGVRIQSVVLGVLTIPAVYLVTSHMFTRRLGLASAGVVALSAFHIIHSQDAKNYILLPLTATLLVYACLRAWEDGGRWWPFYTLLAALSFYSQAFAAPLLVLLNGWFLVTAIREKRPLAPWFAANVAAFLLVLPWIFIMLSKAGDIMIAAEDWWVPRPGPIDLAFTFKTMVFGYSDQKPAFYLVTLAAAALAAWGAWNLYRTHPRHTVLTVLWCAFPILAVYGISQVTNSIYLFRAMLPFTLPLFVLVAAGILAIPRPPVRIAAAVLLFAATLPSLSDHYFREYGPHEFPHRPGIHPPIDYDLAAAAILEGWEEGDRIVLSVGVPMLPLYHYGIRDEAMHMRSISTSPAHIEHLIRSNPPLMLSNPRFQDYYPVLAPGALEGAGRVWFVFSDWEQELLRHDAMSTWRWMDARYTEIAHDAWRGIEVFLYDTSGAREVVMRDHDDGVRAVEVMLDPRLGALEREKTLPDDGIMRRPLHHRRGALVLAWEGADAFTLINESGEDAAFDIHIVQSAGLLPVTAWLDEEFTQQWGVHAWYHAEPPPGHYELPTASIGLEPGTAASISGSIPPALAPLHPTETGLLCWFGPSGDAPAGRARISATIGGAEATIQWDAEGPGWHWSPLHMATPLPTPADGDIPVVITAEASRAEHTTYANLAWLAVSSPAFPATAQVLKGEGIAPHGEHSFPLPDADAPRTDVWVFEHGEGGRVYHIFRERPW